MTVVGNGYEALEALRGEHGHVPLPRPYIVLLDLNLPLMNGIEFLQQLRLDQELKSSVVFVVTTSDSHADMAAAYSFQVAGYFLKSSVERVSFNLPQMMKQYWRMVELPADKRPPRMS